MRLPPSRLLHLVVTLGAVRASAASGDVTAATLLVNISAEAAASSWLPFLDATLRTGLLQPYGHAGPHSVCSVNASTLGRFQEPAGWFLPRFEALVVFPCDSSAAALPGPWPALAFGIGYAGWPQRYAKMLTHVASHGFVVIAPDTLNGNQVPLLLWQHEQTLLLSLAFLGRLPASVLHVDTERCGAFGHSMGASDALVVAALSSNRDWAASLGSLPPWTWPFGAPSLLNMSAPLPNVRAFFSLGMPPENTFPAALAAVRSRGFFLGGSGDYFSPPSLERSFVDAALHAPRTLAVLSGGTHCWVEDLGSPPSECNAAITPALQRILLSPAAQLYITRSLVAAFFAAVLRGDAAAAGLVEAATLRRMPIFSEAADFSAAP